MDRPDSSLSILHILLSIGETSAPYNEHCLAMANERKIAICTYFKSNIVPPAEITLFDGDNSLIGFFRALKAALAQQHYDLIHAHSPHVGLFFLMGTIFKPRNSIPATVFTVHSSYRTYELRHKLMFMFAFAFFQKVVCCSQAAFNSFPAFYKWLAGDRLCAVPNGLDIARVDRIAAKTRPRSPQTSDFTIIAISRFVDIKNPSTVLTAFQQSSDQASRLVCIGEGPLRSSLITKSREEGLENQIEFTGLIPRERTFEHLLNADLFVSASRGEGLPVAVLEAMACRCPVILSDIPPHREIAEGVDFIPLIPPDDVAGFAREINRFREMQASERATIGQKCRKLVEERFSLPAMHAGYMEVYAQVLGQQVPSLLEAT
jgi:glycosyltransferase involved in cell wall biosynthesis